MPKLGAFNGVWRLLSFWGGEAIYWRHCDDHAGVAQRLRSLGGPALVTAYVDLASPGRHLVFKSVVHTFVGKAIGRQPTLTSSTATRSRERSDCPR